MYHWLTWISHELAWISHGLGLISRGLRWISNGPVISQALISWAGSHPAAKVKRYENGKKTVNKTVHENCNKTVKENGNKNVDIKNVGKTAQQSC